MEPQVTGAIILAAVTAAGLIIAATIIGVKLQHIATAHQNVAEAITEGNTIREAATQEAIARIEERAIRAARDTAQEVLVAGLDRWTTEQGSAGRVNSGEFRVTVESDRALTRPGSLESPTGVISAAVGAQARGEKVDNGPIQELPAAFASLTGCSAEMIVGNNVLSQMLFEFAKQFMKNYDATETERLYTPTTRFGNQALRTTWYEAFRAWMRRFGIDLLPLLEQFPGIQYDPEYQAWAAHQGQR